jgi:hypothetical protein
MSRTSFVLVALTCAFPLRAEDQPVPTHTAVTRPVALQPAGKRTIEQLAGRWHPVGGVYNNAALPKKRLGPPMTILLSHDRPKEITIEFHTGSRPSYMYANVLYDQKTKRNLMELRSEVIYADKPADVLYKIDGSRLVIVQDMDTKAFPRDFESRPGDKKVIRIYEKSDGTDTPKEKQGKEEQGSQPP